MSDGLDLAPQSPANLPLKNESLAMPGKLATSYYHLQYFLIIALHLLFMRFTRHMTHPSHDLLILCSDAYS